MFYIIHFTPSDLDIIGQILSATDLKVNSSLAEKISLAISMNSQLGVVLQLQDKELANLQGLVKSAYLHSSERLFRLDCMLIMSNVVMEIASHLWSESDVDI